MYAWNYENNILFYLYGLYYLQICLGTTFRKCSKRPKEVIKSPGARVTDNCEPPCQCWWLNLGPQEEQTLFLTDESFPWPQEYYFWIKSQKWWVTTRKLSSGHSREITRMNSWSLGQKTCKCSSLERPKHRGEWWAWHPTPRWGAIGGWEWPGVREFLMIQPLVGQPYCSL